MSKRAIITGITGQDGSYLAELLLSKGYEVVGVVRRASAPNYWRIQHLLDRVTLRPADLLDQLSLIRLVDEVRPQEFYNLAAIRSEEHTSELQSPCNLVCRLLLEKKKNKNTIPMYETPRALQVRPP